MCKVTYHNAHMSEMNEYTCSYCNNTGIYGHSAYYCVCKVGSSLLSHDYRHRHAFYYTTSDHQYQFNITFVGVRRMDIVGSGQNYQIFISDSLSIKSGKIQWQELSHYRNFSLPQDIIDYAEKTLAMRAFW